MRHISYGTTVIFTVLSGNKYQALEPDPQPKSWTKVEPETKIKNFGSITLYGTFTLVLHGCKFGSQMAQRNCFDSFDVAVSFRFAC